jgi:hypothetical protein
MALGRRRFSFAVIADTHVNQEEGKASSDFMVNRLANARTRHVLHALNRARPAFALHLGDIVHPTPAHPGYAAAADAFKELAAALECPLHLVPGNHDEGDKPGDWLPVTSVNEEYLSLYEQHFGARHFSFDFDDCHFVIVDAQVINSGLRAEAVQRQWLETDLATHAGRRTFLSLHYPPFIFDPAEDGHYDNLDEPGRSWLLGLLARHGVEALFAGHVHNFWYHLLGETDIYLLPSTSFVRLDYSEMYRGEPGPERGRNDTPKLGFMLVDVHERGHVAHPVRTHGACLQPGEELPRIEWVPPVHARSIERSPLGIDLRYPWTEVTEVAASGALDEFSRKTVRNDYPLMALWEMGIRDLRVPVADVRDAPTRERIRALVRSGHRFTVYSHGIALHAQSLLAEHAELVSGWEVIAPATALPELAPKVARIRRERDLAVRFSPLRRPGDSLHHGDRARHVIEHGFHVSEQPQIEALFGNDDVRAAFDGVVYRVSRAALPSQELAQIREASRALDTRNYLYVRFAADNPARMPGGEEPDDANRLAEALFAAHSMRDGGVWVDTLGDVDRGYFPRMGLVDRRANPRMAGRVCGNLNSALSRFGGTSGSITELDCTKARVLTMHSDGQMLALVLPDSPTTLNSIPTIDLAASTGKASCTDLSTGAVSEVGWRTSQRDPRSCALAPPMKCTGPALIGIVIGPRPAATAPAG